MRDWVLALADSHVAHPPSRSCPCTFMVPLPHPATARPARASAAAPATILLILMACLIGCAHRRRALHGADSARVLPGVGSLRHHWQPWPVWLVAL